MMKSLTATFFHIDPRENTVSFISDLLSKSPIQVIDCFPWPSYRSDTAVSFSIGFTASRVFLKFMVKEKAIRAVNTGINSPVYEDSCVEFFIAFDETGYYNFEFNCAGGRLAEFGTNRKNRKFLPSAVVEKIRTETVMRTSNDGFILWDLTIVIPVDAFYNHSIKDISGRECRVNFYKCGDKLPEPHYMAWSPVRTAEPDFHQPQFFGMLSFNHSNAPAQ